LAWPWKSQEVWTAAGDEELSGAVDFSVSYHFAKRLPQCVVFKKRDECGIDLSGDFAAPVFAQVAH
jgi:hypothetical protein